MTNELFAAILFFASIGLAAVGILARCAYWAYKAVRARKPVDGKRK